MKENCITNIYLSKRSPKKSKVFRIRGNLILSRPPPPKKKKKKKTS